MNESRQAGIFDGSNYEVLVQVREAIGEQALDQISLGLSRSTGSFIDDFTGAEAVALAVLALQAAGWAFSPPDGGPRNSRMSDSLRHTRNKLVAAVVAERLRDGQAGSSNRIGDH